MPVTTVLKLDDIKSLIDSSQLIQEIEAGFVLYLEGRVVVPPVVFLHFEQPPGDVHIKYGFVTGDDYYVLKMASGFYNNPALDLPVSDGLLLVFNQKTGQLKLILLGECWLTDMRTAAAGAVAAKHLAPNSIRHIGIVGSRVTGGGFGGCPISLVNQADLNAFIHTLSTRYEAGTGIHPDSFASRPARGAHVVRG